ncbi:MAG: ECF transporter S component [Nitrososphaerota archaeon]|nr:ECF transporter S component [Nitrososphaerota archaeon]
MKINLTSRDITVIAICSALYAVVGYLTGFISFYGIGFLPAVVIPAVFAALYGPWVGGISGAIGIFLRDMLVHGNAPLSLVAGVPPNFVLFFLIGYLYTKSISLKQVLTCVSLAAVGLLVFSIFSIVFPSDVAVVTGGISSGVFLFISALTIVVSLVVIAVVSIRWKEWRSYAIGAVVGQIAGCFLLSVTVWAVSPLFTKELPAMAAIGVLPLFVWLIATEIPFILLVGPPIIKVVREAFPALQYKSKTSQGGGTIAQKDS